MVPVTEEEKKSPLYAYYLRDMAPVPEARYAEATAPVDPEKALKFQDMNLLFDEGYLPVERGCCSLPDGTATLANLTPMPGVTPEMFDWWFAWHGLEPLRYKLWNHDDHYYCLTRNPEISRDASLPMKARYRNTCHDVEENTGMGPEKILIHFRDPADVGFDWEKLAAFKGTIVCAGDEHNPVFMCHFLRPVPGGSELRTRFWMGCSIIDGRPVKVIPDGAVFPLEPARGLLMHNIKEFTNLAAILPELYEKYRDKF